MTISSTHSSVSFVANGSDVEFEFNFVLFDDGDLYVYVAGELVDSADYTVAIDEDESGGSVTFDTAPAANAVVRLTRSMTIDQQTDYPVGGPFPADSHERALDKLTMISQDIMTLVTDESFGVTWAGEWTTATVYPALSLVTNDGKWYACTTAHTSDVFATDLSTGYWRLFLTEPSTHSIASHSDTTATGTELETLTDDSLADALHRHSELSASDGTPNPALSIDAAGLVSLINGTGINEFSTDGTLAGNSDTAVPTEKAVKTYSDANAKFYDAYLRYTEYTADGADGGDSTTGSWIVRVLNREDRDTGSIGSLSSGQVTIPAGTYRACAFSWFYGSGAVTLRLYDHTGAATLIHGASRSTGASTSDNVELSGSFTISVTSAISVQYQCGTSNSGDGLGDDTFNVYSGENIWTQLELWREA